MKTHPLGRILIVDDEIELVNVLCNVLSGQGYEPVGFTSPAKSLETLKEQEFDILLTDIKMPEMNGIELLRASMEIDPDLVGIIMTGQGTIRSAVEALKVRAFDYILKPFKMDFLLPVINRAMQVRRLRKENIELRGTTAIYELIMAINVTMDANIVANKVADAAMEQCRADEVSIMLPTDGGEELYVAAIRGEGREEFLGKRVRMGEGIAGWVAHHRETLILEGEIDDPRFKPIAPRREIKSAISLPMVAGGNFVGVLNINAVRRRSFSMGQIKALNIMVGMAAPSIENSSLFNRMKAIEEKYRDIVENAVEGIFQMTPNGRILMANPSLVRILGYDSPQELLAYTGDIARQVFSDEKQYLKLIENIKELGKVKNFEAQILRKDQREVWALINARVVRNKDGNDLYYEGTIMDISIKKKMEDVLLSTAQEWRNTFDSIGDMVWLSGPDWQIQRCNVAIREYLKKPFPEIIGKPCYQVMHGASAPIEDCPHARMKQTKIRETKIIQIGERWYNLTVDPILDENNNLKGAVHVCSDITLNKYAEEELRAMSHKDELTGLLNRRGFMTLAEQQMKLAQRLKKMLVLFFIDLDRLKWINDTLGHPQGDLALINTGNVLRKTFRESDIIARVGGDEFVVLALNSFDESTEAVVSRLKSNLRAFNAENQGSYPLSFSIGVASSGNEEPLSIDELQAKADQRMYENKKAKLQNSI